MKIIINYLTTVSAFITSYILAVYTQIIFGLATNHAIEFSTYPNQKYLLLSLLIFAVWMMIFFVIAQMFISPRFAHSISIIFLALLYLALVYDIKEMHFYSGAIMMAIITLAVFSIFVCRFSSGIKKYMEPFATRFCVILLSSLPFGLYLSYEILPAIFVENFQAIGLL